MDSGDELERLTIAEAAVRLGTSTEAVRKRADRGRIRSERADGKVYILLPRQPPPAPIDAEISEPPAVAPAGPVDVGDVSDVSDVSDQVEPDGDAGDPRDELIAQLRDEVAYLRETLHREQAISARLATTLEASRALPPASPAASDQTGSGDRTRSWWRRIWGG